MKLGKEYWIPFSIVSFFTLFGSLMIYAKQHTPMSFDISEFLLWSPLPIFLVFIVSIGIGVFNGD